MQNAKLGREMTNELDELLEQRLRVSFLDQTYAECSPQLREEFTERFMRPLARPIGSNLCWSSIEQLDREAVGDSPGWYD